MWVERTRSERGVCGAITGTVWGEVTTRLLAWGVRKDSSFTRYSQNIPEPGVYCMFPHHFLPHVAVTVGKGSGYARLFRRRMSALENLNVLPFVNTRVKNGYTSKVEELRIVFPGVRGISVRSLKRFCATKHNLHSTTRCSDEVLNVLVAYGAGICSKSLFTEDFKCFYQCYYYYYYHNYY